MKKTLILVASLLISFSAGAQQLFDFNNNNGRLEVGLIIGKAGMTTPYEAWGPGASLVAWGFQLDYLQAGPEHKYDHHVTDTKWNDKVAFTINAGYQIPVLSWLRITPIVGYSQTNDGITDGSTMNVSWSDHSSTLYHDYDVTPGSRTHYFNYGGGISIQPLPWFSLNAVYSRYAIYGSITFDLPSLANL